MTHSEDMISLTEQYGAPNYKPLPVVITKGQGIWLEDAEGRRYMDMLSAYSAMNLGHCHPDMIKALKEQADKVTLTSRAFYSEPLGRFYALLSALTGKDMILPMNTGAEAVETAIKAARRWAYRVKQLPMDQAEIIVCQDNFHGRTVTATSASSTHEYRADFGPFTPGFRYIPYGDIEALEQAITPMTAAFLVEPIQGEAGIIIPPRGYLKAAEELCRKHRVLLIADEIQTGLGRTGRVFACDWEQVVPDIYLLGKALGGGMLPISAVAASRDILELFEPGSHGSTFGGNPLACAVAIAALDVFERDQLAERSERLGAYFIQRLAQIECSIIREVRGRGLFIGVELTVPARPLCEALMQEGLLCKETHEYTIRLAPPLIISQEQLDDAYAIIVHVLERYTSSN